MIYIITFIISICFFVLASVFKKINKFLFYIFTSLGIMIPCILAACRDISIGTDVEVYIKGWFDYAKQCSSFNYFVNNLGIGDFLYLLITYCSAKLFNDISYLFFIIQLLNIVPIVIALNKYDEKVNVPFAMILYFLFFYNMSFNIARQSISLSFFILGFTYLLNGKQKKFFVFLLIAFLFHSSAILGLGVYLIFITSNKKNSYIYIALYLFAILLILLNFKSIISILINIGILPVRYNLYITKYLRSELDFNFVNNFFYLIIFSLNLFIYNSKNFQKKYLLQLFVVGLAIFEFGIISSFANRASYYFLFPYIFLYLPQIFSKKEKLTKNKILIATMTIIIFIVYWVFWITIENVHETYPFVFKI